MGDTLHTRFYYPKLPPLPNARDATRERTFLPLSHALPTEGMGTCARRSGVLMDIATDDCAGAKACGQLTGLHGRVIAFLADQGLPPSRVAAAAAYTLRILPQARLPRVLATRRIDARYSTSISNQYHAALAACAGRKDTGRYFAVPT